MEAHEPSHGPELIRELFQLGWEVEFIAQALAISVDQVREALAALDPPATRPPTSRGAPFAASLRRYAELHEWSRSGKLPYRYELMEALETLLDVRAIHDFLAGVARILEPLITPAVPHRLQPYYRLLTRVRSLRQTWSERDEQSSLRFHREALFLWTDFAWNLEYREVPASLEHLKEALVPFCANVFRTQVRGRWNDSVADLMDQIIAELPEEEATVLRLQFGLGGSFQRGRGLSTIAQQLEKPVTEVKQVANRALRRLGHPRYWQRLRHLLQPLQETVDELSVRITQLEALLASRMTAVPGMTPERYKLLATPVRDLGFSPKLHRVFRNVKIVTLADLVRHQREYTLRWKNFGWKSLLEAEAVLAAMGLSFGMDLPPDLFPKKKR